VINVLGLPSDISLEYLHGYSFKFQSVVKKAIPSLKTAYWVRFPTHLFGGDVLMVRQRYRKVLSTVPVLKAFNMTKKKYCDRCQNLEFISVYDGQMFIPICSLSKQHCSDERSGFFKDTCGPSGKNYVGEGKNLEH
jgi:hypothetical protein